MGVARRVVSVDEFVRFLTDDILSSSSSGLVREAIARNQRRVIKTAGKSMGTPKHDLALELLRIVYGAVNREDALNYQGPLDDVASTLGITAPRDSLNSGGQLILNLLADSISIDARARSVYSRDTGTYGQMLSTAQP